MANKFDVWVYRVQEEYNHDDFYNISADFVDMDGNVTPCEIVNIGIHTKSAKYGGLYIDDYMTEKRRDFGMRLLEADEFSIEVRCRNESADEHAAIGCFADILRYMSRVYYDYGYDGISCNLRDTPRDVKVMGASLEPWDEQKMKMLLSVLGRATDEFVTLGEKSHVQKVNLDGGQVDVSEVMASLETMQANFFDKLYPSRKQ